jgi:hypothetical protein
MASVSFPSDPNRGDFGDFIDSDDECEVDADAEPLSGMIKDCTLLLTGEVLNQRHRIEHKLGWGSFSTI